MTAGGHSVILVAALASMGVLAVLAPILERFLGRNAGYALSAGFVGVAVVLGWTAPTALAGGAVTASWPWIPDLGVSFTLRLDGLTALFCLLVLGVGALIMAYCPRYLPAGGPHGLVYFLLTLFGGAMLGLVLSGDLVLMFVFWELTSIISFFLIGAPGARSVRAAVRALLVTGAGGLAFLVAIVLLATVTGTTDLTAILAAPGRVLGSPVAPVVAALIIVAAFTKSAQIPFHFWLPGAMVAITPVSAYLHAATMVKAGIYLLLRFSTLYAGRPGWSLTLTGVGLLTAVLGAATALREHDLKALLAHSTVSQLGLLVAAIGVGTTAALAAAVLHTFAHALFKATLFMLVGVIDREAGSRDIRELSGLMRVMPVTATLTGLAGMSLAGIPPMIGFVSKESLFQGFVGARAFPGAGAVFGTLAIAASALTFAYGVRILYGAFAGPTLQRRLYEPAWSFLAPAGVAAVAGAVLGPAVIVLNPLMRQAILDVEPWGRPPYFALWHGFGPELLMTGVTIMCGTGLFLARDPVDRVLRRVPPLGGAMLFDRLYRGTLRFGAVVGRTAHRDATRVYLAPPVAAVVLLGGVAALGAHRRPLGPPSGPMDWVLLILLAAVVAGLLWTRSVLGAVALLGLIGLIVTTWFILAGAPDVALTLVLVEVLTAMVAAFVLRGLPPGLPRPDRCGRRAAGASAGLAGLAGA
ncbi:proton-conducting transporter transmembrane domain-containing protein, partial [Actinoallomurus acaciae]